MSGTARACTALAAVAALLGACESSGAAPTTAASGRDTANASDAPERPITETGVDDPADTAAPADVGAEDDDDDTLSFDTVTTDAFVRPETTRQDVAEPEEDAPTDLPPDAADAEAGEVGGPDRVLAGTYDCLRYEIRVSDTRFHLKVDDIRVTYFVQNVCATPYQVRVEHFSDFFAIGIHRDGAPWIFLPDCPGTGDTHDYTFTPVGGGVNRGWIWTAADHETRMARCGVTFDDAAAYTIVGYGATEVDLLDTTSWSEVFVMTDPIEIELRL